MFSFRRQSSASSSSSSPFSGYRTFSSDSFSIPATVVPRPEAPRQFNVGHLGRYVTRDFIDQRPIRRDLFRIPRPVITVPHPAIHVPISSPIWTPIVRPTLIPYSSISSSPLSVTYRSDLPVYQNIPFEPSLPSIPKQQQQAVPVTVQRFAPISIVQPIKKVKRLRERPAGLFSTLSAGGLNTTAVLIYLCFLLALPLTKLILGILYVDECPVNKNIPLYMIVAGACGLTIIVLLFFSSICTFYRSTRDIKKPTHALIICTISFSRGIQGILTIFLFIWFLFGNIWIFNAQYRVRTDRPNDKINYCHPTLYWFAFYVTIFTYIYALLTCCCKFCVQFFCCGICDTWRKAFS